MKRISRFIIPLALLALWGFLTLSYIFDYSPSLSVISYPHNKSNFINFNTNRLYAGQKFIGEFVADENYLGIVSVSFATFGSKVAYLGEDNLVFRIKQLEAKDWYYGQTYKSGLMYDVPLYPFGFPKINDSKGKRYMFEIESLNGNNLNAVALDMWEPVLIARYQPPRDELLQSNTRLFDFFGKKLLVAFGSRDVQFFSFVYLLPLLFYFLLFIYPFKNITTAFLGTFFQHTFLLFLNIFKKAISRLERIQNFKKFTQSRVVTKAIHLLELLAKHGASSKYFLKKHLDIVLVFIILMDVSLITVVNDIVFIVVIALWAMLVKHYKYASKESFVVGFIFLALCPFILLFKLDDVAEKSAVWAYLFFVAGSTQALIALRGAKD